MWAIIYPVAYLPLMWSLIVNQRKAKRMGKIPPKQYTGTLMSNIKHILLDLDVLGLLLFTAGLIMFLVPLTLGSGWGWSNGRTVSLIVIGILTLIAFVVLETIPKITPRPMMSWRLLGDRTLVHFLCWIHDLLTSSQCRVLLCSRILLLLRLLPSFTLLLLLDASRSWPLRHRCREHLQYLHPRFLHHLHLRLLRHPLHRKLQILDDVRHTHLRSRLRSHD